MSQRNLTMMTDLYQLTMMHGHFMRNAKKRRFLICFSGAYRKQQLCDRLQGWSKPQSISAISSLQKRTLPT